MAWCAIWFLMCFKKSVVPCTSTKLDQVKDVLWREVSKWIGISIEKGKYGSIVKDTLMVRGEKIFVKGITGEEGKEWYAIARSAANKEGSDTPAETLQGFHAQHMMIIVDEATGVADNVFLPLDQTLTDPCNFMIMTYNPTRTTGFAYRSQHKDKQDWIPFRWNCEESENVNQEAIDRIARKYGKDSNAYRISVLGLEPAGDTDSVIALDDIQACVDLDIEVDDETPGFIGVDIGFKGDPSAIVYRKGHKILDIYEKNHHDSDKILDWCNEKISQYEDVTGGACDSGGVGFTVSQQLSKIWPFMRQVHASNSARNPDKYFRVKDELWDKVKYLFQRRLISIPDDEELIYELSSVRYKSHAGHKIKIESKEEAKRRGVASPNKADALILSFFFNDEVYYKSNQLKRDYNDDYDLLDKSDVLESWMAY